MAWLKPVLLWIGDAACPSGFGRATEETLKVLRTKYDVVVLGLNYRGDPHRFPYPIYAALSGGDWAGLGRLNELVSKFQPSVIIIQNDPWNFGMYHAELRNTPNEFWRENHPKIPVIGAVAVDGKNCDGKALNELTAAIFWTQFAHEEAREGGFLRSGFVVPLGVDLETYKPQSRLEARRALFPGIVRMEEAFIVGNVNRNQIRKRLDLTIRYFAQWWHSHNRPSDAYLFLHVAPTGDIGCDLVPLARYYGIHERVCYRTPLTFFGVSEKTMANTYSAFDVQVSTTQGEGFGLTTFEGMASGVPQIVPKWSALEELTKDAALQIECTSTCVHGNSSVIGGVPDEALFVEALQRLYTSVEVRDAIGAAGLRRVSEPQFRWPAVGHAFLSAVEAALKTQPDEEVKDGEPTTSLETLPVG